MMGQSSGIFSLYRQRNRFAWCGVVLSIGCSGYLGAQELPPLWGYGGRLCENFHTARTEADQGIDRGILEYRRYQDWLQGFLSGLNLATGQDLLRGGEMTSLWRGVERQCEDKPDKSLVTAIREALRDLSSIPMRLGP